MSRGIDHFDLDIQSGDPVVPSKRMLQNLWTWPTTKLLEYWIVSSEFKPWDTNHRFAAVDLINTIVQIGDLFVVRMRIIPSALLYIFTLTIYIYL